MVTTSLEKALEACKEIFDALLTTNSIMPHNLESVKRVVLNQHEGELHVVVLGVDDGDAGGDNTAQGSAISHGHQRGDRKHDHGIPAYTYVHLYWEGEIVSPCDRQ